MGMAVGIGGLISVPPAAIRGHGVPPTSFKGILGQMYFDLDTTPPTQYVYNGQTWAAGGDSEATTTTFGSVQLATLSELQNGNAPAGAIVPLSNDVATVIAGIVVGAVPPATETQAGIAEIATQAETNAGALDDKIVTPLKLATYVAGGSGAGSFTDLTATGTVSFTGATGGITMTSATASSFGTTGAGIDLTLSSAAGRVVVNGEEAAADAVRILSAAGGLDVDVALQMNLTSSQNAVDAVRILASAGGIDIDAVGAATEDINITNTGGSIVLQATESAVDSIDIISTAGGIRLRATGAAATEDISLTSTGSSIVLSATEAVSDAINIDATAGGIDVDAVGQINIATSQSAADSIVIESTAGGIDILASGAAAGEDIDIIATGSSVNIQATESDINAITINASGAAGGINVDSGTSGVIVDTTGAISLDSAAASNLTVTGAFALDLISTLGKVTLQSGQSAADSVVISSLIGGIDILAAGAAAGEDIDIIATGSSVNIRATESAADSITIVSTAGGIDILASGAAAGEDIDIVATGSSVNITSTEDVAEAIYIRANGGTSETIRLHADQGTGVASINIGSDVGGVTISGGLGTADAVNITANTAGGGIDIDASTAGIIADTTGAISLDSAAASNFTVTGAFDLLLNSTLGSVNLTAGEVVADSMVITNNGMDIVIAGAATRDFDLTNTGGSVNITATENVSDAIMINASGAASGMTLDCGTASLTIGTGIKHAVTSTNTAATPYAVLGTDYFITTDTTGGAMTVTLPAVPGTGRTVVVYDGAGQAAAGGNVTIDGNGNNIAAAGTSAATKLINTAYESYILTFNGTIWCGQNIV